VSRIARPADTGARLGLTSTFGDPGSEISARSLLLCGPNGEAYQVFVLLD
jgi:hypothetical protein